MEVVKENKEYTVYKKRSGRFGVRGSNRKWINGKSKVEILVKEGLVKAAIPAKEEVKPEPVAEPAAEE